MFSKTTIYEFKMLVRSGWVLLLSILLLLLIGFASYNGFTKVEKRTADIEKARKKLEEDDKLILKQIAEIESGVDLGLSKWKSPDSPSAIGYNHPRLVSMDAKDLSYISTGQSDMYTHYMKPLIFGQLFALDHTEITNPVQLLFGTFDVTFVFIFIIPLLIIAFTYNTLSKEKEIGTLRLVGSQPVAIHRWLFNKMALRFAVFAFISVFSFALFALVFSSASVGSMLLVIAILLVYELFWFIVAYIVNLKINNSSKNAISLIGLWLVITLIIPATGTQLSTSLYPAPSRLNMVNEIREKEREMEEKKNEIMDSYLQDHPELSEGISEDKKFGFWENYFASQDLLTKELKPLLENHKEALTSQQKVVGYFKYISPSLIMSDAMNSIAGTSTNDYEDYKKQVSDFANSWRQHIQVLLFKNRKYTKATHDNRPKWTFSALPVTIFGSILTLIILSILTIIVGFLWKTKSYF